MWPEAQERLLLGLTPNFGMADNRGKQKADLRERFRETQTWLPYMGLDVDAAPPRAPYQPGSFSGSLVSQRELRSNMRSTVID